LISWYQVIS